MYYRMPIVFNSHLETKEYSNIFGESLDEIYDKFEKLLKEYQGSKFYHGETVGWCGKYILASNGHDIKIDENRIVKFLENFTVGMSYQTQGDPVLC